MNPLSAPGTAANTASTTATTLAMEDLSLTYETSAGPNLALRHVSLRVARGETYGLVGESGCGKSTAALAMLGYLTAMGLTVGYMTPQQLTAREQAYSHTWARIIKSSGFVPQ